jgi:hypothetical protein
VLPEANAVGVAVWGISFEVDHPRDYATFNSDQLSDGTRRIATMSTPDQRRRMAAAIVNFEARRDKKGHLVVYKLPKGDGGGKYEVAGINERYNKATADALVALIDQGRFDEAESLATDFIAEDTDRAAAWTTVPAVEFYLRDCVFNRGAGGGARILQRALDLADDGVIGPQTRTLEKAAEQDSSKFLGRLRAARELTNVMSPIATSATNFGKDL